MLIICSRKDPNPMLEGNPVTITIGLNSFMVLWAASNLLSEYTTVKSALTLLAA